MKTYVPHEKLGPLRSTLVLVFLCVSIWYLIWRLGTFNQTALFFSISLYAVEVYGFLTTLMHLFITWRLTVREPQSPEDGITVDIFVTTINESVNLLRRTLLASREMEYPHTTWLLDDGRRPEMEALAVELGCRYLSRPNNTDAKAGNLNNALQFSRAKLIAVFDADHAPKKNFLLRTIGYFQDPSVAFVQTPQDFYNLDSYQHPNKKNSQIAWHEQSVFFRIIQRGKDYANAAFFCGSCALIRRSSLDAIGGFATGTVTEDLHTSVRIHKKGFTSIYHAESLAFGLAPSGIVSFLKQRIRWGQGAMQVWRKEGVFFCRNLTWSQRINYLASTVTYFDGWQKGFYYVAPIIVLVTGTMPIISFGPEFLLHFIPYFILTFWVFEEVNRGYGRSWAIEQYNMSRFAAMAWSTFGILKKKIRFAVTSKVAAPSSDYRFYSAPQSIVFAGNLLAIPVGIVLYASYQHLPTDGVIANIIWASVNSILAASVLAFSSIQARFRRNDYRFQIPLPALVRFADSPPICGTIDDISSTGFRLYSALPASTEINQPISGTIILPSGLVRFSASIKTLFEESKFSERYIKAIGCNFTWSDSSESDRLDLFLYGTDLQWRVNDLRDWVHTPLEWLSRLFTRKNPSIDPKLSHWSTMVYLLPGHTDNSTGMGLISEPHQGETKRKLILFTPVAEGIPLSLHIHNRSKGTRLTGVVQNSTRIDESGSPVYAAVFVPELKGDS